MCGLSKVAQQKCEAFLVFVLVEYSAFGVGGRFINDSFFRRSGVVKWLLAVLFTVFVDFFHQLSLFKKIVKLLISPYIFRYSSFEEFICSCKTG